MILALIYGKFILMIAQCGQGLSIIQFSKKYFPIYGIILGFILVLFFILIAFVYLRDFENFMGLHLPNTPPVVLGLVLLLLGAYAIKEGLEVLLRVAEFLVLPVLLLVAAGIIYGLFTIKTSPILLPLENWKSTAHGIMFQFANYAELIVLTMILPMVRSSVIGIRFIFIPIILIGLLIVVLAYVLYGNFSTYTVHIIYKLLELYHIAGRIESLFLVLWVSTFLIKISIFFYASVKGLGEILGLKKHEPLVFPVAIIITFLSLISFSGYSDYNAFVVIYYPLIALSVELGMPLMFLVAVVIGSRAKVGRSKG